MHVSLIGRSMSKGFLRARKSRGNRFELLAGRRTAANVHRCQAQKNPRGNPRAHSRRWT